MGSSKSNIDREHLKEKYKNLAYRIAEKIKVYPGVEGICLNGSVSRGSADRYSDVDLLIYFNHTGYRELVEKKLKFPVPQLSSKLKGIVISVQWLDLSEEMKRQWTDVEKWDRSHCLILFDRKKNVRKLFITKLRHFRADRDRRIFTLLGEIKHNLKLAQSMIKSKHLVASHLIMNRVLSDILTITFFINGEYPPIKKWQLHLVYSLHWIPSCLQRDKVCISLSSKVDAQQSFARYRLFKKSYKECLKKASTSITGEQ